jgi:hypothetical protein
VDGGGAGPRRGGGLSHRSAATLWGLRVAGYGLTRISWAQLDDEPAAIAADLRALLGLESDIQMSVITYADR